MIAASCCLLPQPPCYLHALILCISHFVHLTERLVTAAAARAHDLEEELATLRARGCDVGCSERTSVRVLCGEVQALEAAALTEDRRSLEAADLLKTARLEAAKAQAAAEEGARRAAMAEAQCGELRRHVESVADHDEIAARLASAEETARVASNQVEQLASQLAAQQAAQLLAAQQAERAHSMAEAALAAARADAEAAECAAAESREELERLRARQAEVETAERVARQRADELSAAAERQQTAHTIAVDEARRDAEAAAQATATSWQRRLAKLISQHESMQNRAEQQQAALDSMRSQLESAVQSSVRLCVVAPTVNVTFGGEKLSHKALLPRDKIAATLETEVLPAFTRAFVQEHEQAAPEGGGTMDDWLKEVTASMQSSIQKHLGQVFKEA
jgi:hypothetical protein